MRHTQGMVLGILGLLLVLVFLVGRPWTGDPRAAGELHGYDLAGAADSLPGEGPTSDVVLDKSIVASERSDPSGVVAREEAGGAAVVTITGSCADNLGAPVPSVELSFLPEQQFLGRTDASGGFAVSRRESPRSLCGRRLVAYRLGFRPSEVMLPPARERRIDVGAIVLEAGAEIGGLVGVEERPLANCTVHLLPAGLELREAEAAVSSRRGSNPLEGSMLQTRSGPDGRFRFVGTPLGTWEAWAIEYPFEPAHSAALSVEAGDRVDVGRIVVRLPAAEGLIQGVLVHPDGTLCHEGVVRHEFKSAGRWTAGPARMDSGAFVLATLDIDGQYALTGHPDAKEPYIASEPVHPQPGDAKVVIRLRPARYLTLSVVDAHGAPVEDFGYRIELASRGVFPGTPAWCAGAIEHHAGGTAELKIADEPGKVVVFSHAYHDGSSAELANWDRGRMVKVVVEARSRIEGRVVTPGESLSEILVQAAPIEWTRNFLVSASVPWEGERIRSTTAEEDGRFVLYVDAPGSYILGLSSLAYQSMIVPAIEVGQQIAVPDLHVSLASE